MTENNLTNWGRWGPDDQIGVLNLLTPELILKACSLVKKGKIYSLAVPLERDGPQFPAFQKTWRVSHWEHKENPDLHIIDDVVTMETHSGTHIDAIGHVWAEGYLYNNFSEEYAGSQGIQRDGIENVRHMVGRGIMLDIPAYRGIDHLGPAEVVTVEDLDGAASAQGITLEPGDIVLIRTGWYQLFDKDRALWESTYPGPDGSAIPWLKEHDVCAIGADQPSCELKASVAHGGGSPLHRYALRDLGVYILENLDLEELARDKVYEFLFIGAPLRLIHGTGSPWNPPGHCVIPDVVGSTIETTRQATVKVEESSGHNCCSNDNAASAR
jgi:kynurenine formamidase